MFFSLFLLNPEIHISTPRSSSNLRIGTRFNKRVPASWVPVDSLSYNEMPVDKFGRNGDRTTPVYTGINIANLTNSFLRRDGGNTAIGAIHMNSYIIKNVADPLSNQDVGTKNYVDKNDIITDGGVVYGDIKLSVGSDLVRSLGCSDLTTGKKFTLLLGTDTNVLSYSLPDSELPVLVKIKTDEGFAILINQLAICDFGQDEISCSQPIDMNLHLIKNVKCPVNKSDAVNKAYADHINFKSTIGIISNIAITDDTLFTFPAQKAFASEKIIICEMWVEQLADEWISTSSKMFATVWPGFHKFSRGPSLMTFFTGSPASGWTRNFRPDYIELP